jgi:predicted SprT family Zn-dependent metalloprotease
MRRAKPAPAPTPTTHAYPALAAAYDYFNKVLFGDQLPGCLITLQGKSKAYGHFAGDRYGSTSGAVVDEISLNPKHFEARNAEDIFSTLVHEQVHQQQKCFGKPSRRGYHNKEWGEMMEEVGLIPSSTGKPGGKRTGQKVSHYVVADGPYAIAFRRFKFDETALYRDLWEEKKKTTSVNKTKYACPECELNLWGKPDVRVMCLECECELEAA